MNARLYIDLNMVRAGAVRHPSERNHGGYAEIQNPERYRVINPAALSSLCGFGNVAEFQSEYRQWVEAALRDGPTARDDRWSDAIAVGSESFVVQVKAELGSAVGGRQITAENKTYALREPSWSYSAHLDGKNSALSQNNAYICQMTAKDSNDDEALFSRAYLRSESAQRDSARFRTRLSALFEQCTRDANVAELAENIRREIGVEVPKTYYGPGFDSFFKHSQLRDVLDAITLAWQVMTTDDWDEFWVSNVRRIFHEENLGYSINEVGAVRYLVDQEFERTRFSLIDGLGASKFKAVKTAVDNAFSNLDSEPFDTKSAVRSMFEAMETLFKVLGNHNQDLNEAAVRKQLLPVVSAFYSAQDPSAQSFAQQMLEAFGKWVNAGHKYRHGPNAEEPHNPPLELAIAYIGNGASYIRFLIDLYGKGKSTVA